MKALKFKHKELYSTLSEITISISAVSVEKDFFDVTFDSSGDQEVSIFSKNVLEDTLLFNGLRYNDFFESIENNMRLFLKEVDENLTFLRDDEHLDYIKSLHEKYSIVFANYYTDESLLLKLASIPSIRIVCDNSALEVHKELLSAFHEKILKILRQLLDQLNKFQDETIDDIKVERKNQKPTILVRQQLKWNGQVNQLVDIFYRLLHELKNKQGVHFLEGNNVDDVANFILKGFVDREGKALSEWTINTCLKPGKPEKRPSTDKQIDIETSLRLE